MSSLGRVLIIDDEALLRRTLSRVLQSAGCAISSAENGQQALHLLEENTFDLVLLDIHLPGMDGLQILKAIREREAQLQVGDTLPVILLTGFGTIQSAVEALRLGATDYLLKPVDPEVLVARTRVLLEEQAVERRRREIIDQIAALQAELRTLEVRTQRNAFSESKPASEFTQRKSEFTGIVPPTDRFYKRGKLILDLQAQRATWEDKVLNLPPAAFDYLAVLAKYSPEVVEYQALVEEAQKYQVESGEARLLAKWHVHVLRQAIETDLQNPVFLLNVRGAGYRLLTE